MVNDMEVPPLDMIDDMMAWENGELDREQTICLFQKLIDNGMAWQLQGMYGRTAARLIDEGFCHRKGG